MQLPHSSRPIDFSRFFWSIRHSQRTLHTPEHRVSAFGQIIFYTERPILVFARISRWLCVCVCVFVLKCVRAKMLHCVSECKGREAYFRLECCAHLGCAIFVPEPNWAWCFLRNGTCVDMYYVRIFVEMQAISGVWAIAGQVDIGQGLIYVGTSHICINNIENDIQ